MGSKRKTPSSTEEVEIEVETGKEKANDATALKPEQDNQKKSLKPMERRKKRKQMDKEKHHSDLKSKPETNEMAAERPPLKEAPLPSSSAASSPGFHINVFRDLASADLAVRKAAAETLVVELIEVQRAYEMMGGEKGKEEEGAVQLEAEKDDGLMNCAPSLRYAIRRLIRGVSSSREVITCLALLVFVLFPQFHGLILSGYFSHILRKLVTLRHLLWLTWRDSYPHAGFNNM